MSIAYEGLRFVESVRPDWATSDPRFTEHAAYFAMVMDLQRGIVSDSERHEAIITMTVRLAQLPSDIPTLDVLRRRYAAGMFEAAFIHRELRPWLETRIQG